MYPATTTPIFPQFLTEISQNHPSNYGLSSPSMGYYRSPWCRTCNRQQNHDLWTISTLVDPSHSIPARVYSPYKFCAYRTVNYYCEKNTLIVISKCFVGKRYSLSTGGFQTAILHFATRRGRHHNTIHHNREGGGFTWIGRWEYWTMYSGNRTCQSVIIIDFRDGSGAQFWKGQNNL